MNFLIMYLSNEGEHAAACQGNSSIPTNATHLLPSLLCLYKSRCRPSSHFNPITDHNTSVVACALPRLAWKVHSARHKRLNLGTTVHIAKGFPELDRYINLYLIVYLSVYISICSYICICNNNVRLYP